MSKLQSLESLSDLLKRIESGYLLKKYVKNILKKDRINNEFFFGNLDPKMRINDATSVMYEEYFRLVQSTLGNTIKTLKYDSRTMVYYNITDPDVIIKAYPVVQKIRYTERNEDDVSRYLDENGFGVPHRYPKYETEYLRCYPMERVEMVLGHLQTTQPHPLSDSRLSEIAGVITKILERLADKFCMLYSDISPWNIGFRTDGSPVLFDFGSLTPYYNHRPDAYINQFMAFTLRYTSIRNEQHLIDGVKTKPTILDDYESLGYVMIESKTMDLHLLDNPSVDNKKSIVQRAINGDFGEFLKCWFESLGLNV